MEHQLAMERPVVGMERRLVTERPAVGMEHPLVTPVAVVTPHRAVVRRK